MLETLERWLLSGSLPRRLLFNPVTGSVGAYVEAARKRGRYARYRDRYDVHPSFEFKGAGIEILGPGEVDLGEDSYVGRYTRIQAEPGTTVRIGDNTAVSYHVHLFTENRAADQDMSAARNRREHLAVERGDVAIGDDCWVGVMAVITEGCAVGDNSVVGANSVVTADLPPGCIAAGSPARVLRFKSHLPDERVDELAAEHRDVLSDSLAERLREAGRIPE